MIKLICHKNLFLPQLPAFPHCGNLTYQFRLGEGFFAEHLTEPEHFGVKLFYLGSFDPHRTAMNTAIIDGGKLVTRFYYDGICYQNNDSIQLEQDTWYTLKMEKHPMRWYLDRNLIDESPESISGIWVHWPFTGKRIVAEARQTLLIELK